MSKKLRIIGIIAMAVAAVFLVQRFLAFDVEFAELFTAKTVPPMLFVTVAVMFTLFLGSCIWATWLSFFADKKPKILAAYSVYAKSNIAKYLPGNVGHYAIRQLYGTTLGIRQKDLFVSSVLEILCIALTAFILSLILAGEVVVAYIKDLLSHEWALPVIIIVAAAIVIVIVFLTKKKGFKLSSVTDYLRRKHFWRSFVSVFGITTVCMFIYGGTLLLLVNLYAGAGSVSLLMISGGIVSWFVGFATPGVPGGIGVREAVLLLMLSHVMTEDVILYAALLQRISFVLADAFTWITGKLAERYVEGKAAEGHVEGGE